MGKKKVKEPDGPPKDEVSFNIFKKCSEILFNLINNPWPVNS